MTIETDIGEFLDSWKREVSNIQQKDYLVNLVRLIHLICNTAAVSLQLINDQGKPIVLVQEDPLKLLTSNNKICESIHRSNQMVMIEDTLDYPSTRTSFDILENLQIRFLVAYPLFYKGQKIGSICLADVRPGKLNGNQLEGLKIISTLLAM